MVFQAWEFWTGEGRSSSLYAVSAVLSRINFSPTSGSQGRPRANPLRFRGDSSRERGDFDVNTWAVTCVPHRISCGSAASSWGAKGW